MDALLILSFLGIILLIGILCTLASKKLEISNVLLLVIIGIILNKIKYNGESVIRFPGVFLTSIGILALVMIVFEASSKFKLRQFDALSLKTIKLTVLFLVLNILFLSLFTKLIFGIGSIFLVIMFSALMSGTDPAAIISMLGKTKSRVCNLLKIESLINTPLIVLLPFIILDLMVSINPALFITNFIDQIIPFLQQIVVGIGAGILMGLIVLKVMKKSYSVLLSPLAIITAALLTYTIAENLKGNGVLAVTTMGVFFGSIYLKEKSELIEFSSLFANSLEILVFILVGLSIELPFNIGFFVKSLILFIILLAIRFASVSAAFFRSDFDIKEKLFMTLNVQKGIAVAAIAFTLTTYKIQQVIVVEGVEKVISTPFISVPGAVEILHLILAFMVYSIILSTVVIKLSTYFIKREIKEEDTVK